MFSRFVCLLAASLLLAAPHRVSAETPAGPYGLDNINCSSQFYKIQADSTNTKFVGIDQGSLNQTVITSLIELFTVAPENFTQQYTQGTFQHSATYRIFGTLCTPIQGVLQDAPIQLLVHGVGVDSRYWDFEASFLTYSTSPPSLTLDP